MGDPAGETADRVHLAREVELFLALAQRALGGLAVGHVARVDDDSADTRHVQQVARGDLQPAPGSVLVQDPQLGEVELVGRMANAREDGARFREIIRVDELQRIPAQPLVGGEAEDALERRTRVPQPALRIEHGHDVGRVLDQRAEVLLAAPQRFGRGLAVVYIAQQPRDADDVRAQGARRLRPQFDPPDAAARRRQPDLAPDVRPHARDQLGVVPFGIGAVDLIDVREQRAADRGFRRAAGDRAPRRIEEGDASLAIGLENDLADALHDRAVARLALLERDAAFPFLRAHLARELAFAHDRLELAVALAQELRQRGVECRPVAFDQTVCVDARRERRGRHRVALEAGQPDHARRRRAPT